MLIDLEKNELPADLKADVIVAGAGAVGLSMAVDLVRRGSKVVLLEAGPSRFEKKSQEFFETATWQGHHLEGLHVGRRRSLGGTTTAWPGQLVRFDPIVFEHRPWVSELSWPISRATLDPFYARAFDLLGLQKNMEDDEVWRELKLATPDFGEDVEMFLTRWTPEPNFATLFKKEIEQHPNLTVVLNAPVTSLAQGSDEKTIEEVVVRRLDGKTQRLKARRIVLANGTVEIVRLLSLPLADGARAPWSENACLAHGFTDHVDAYAGTVTPIDKKRFHQSFDNIMLRGLKYAPKVKLSGAGQRRHEMLGIAAQFLFHSSHKDDLDKLKLPVKALLNGRIDKRTLTIPGLVLPLAKIALPMTTRYLLHKRAFNLPDRGIQLRIHTEQSPLKESRLTLRQERDAFGIPLVDVNWQIDGAQLETMARFCEMIAESFKARGLAQVDIDPRLVARDQSFLNDIDDGNHQMGMARMGATPADGVVDADLKVFGTENLYVAGAAVFPTTGFENPTFTAITLGLRLSDHLIAKGTA